MHDLLLSYSYNFYIENESRKFAYDLKKMEIPGTRLIIDIFMKPEVQSYVYSIRIQAIFRLNLT